MQNGSQMDLFTLPRLLTSWFHHVRGLFLEVKGHVHIICDCTHPEDVVIGLFGSRLCNYFQLQHYCYNGISQ